jgi:hypothetical protein
MRTVYKSIQVIVVVFCLVFSVLSFASCGKKQNNTGAVDFISAKKMP